VLLFGDTSTTSRNEEKYEIYFREPRAYRAVKIYSINKLIVLY